MTSAFWKIHTYIDINVVCQNINFLCKLILLSFDWRKKSVNDFEVRYETPPLWQELSGKIFRVLWRTARLWKCFTLCIYQPFENLQRPEISFLAEISFLGSMQPNSLILVIWKKKKFLFKVFDFLSILPKILKWKINTTYKTLISLFWKSFKNETNKFL